MVLSGDFAQNLAGSLIVAVFCNLGLLGILIIQTYTYYLAFPKDRLLAKTLVYTVLILEIIQTVVLSQNVYAAFVPSFGLANAGDALDSMHQHWLTIPVFGGLTGGIGQFFFAYRLWCMGGKGHRGAPITISILAAASVCSALVSAQTFYEARTFSNLLTNGLQSLVSIGVWNGIGAICDITIALTMPYYLMRHGTGLRSTHVVIVNLVRLIIETGVLTAIFAILHLCLYFSDMPSFLVPGIVISKIYANTMLVILNNRVRIVGGRLPGLEDDIELSSTPINQTGSVSTGGNRRNSGAPRGLADIRSTSRILVTKDRLTFRLDAFDERQRALERETEREKMRSSTDISSRVSTAKGDEIYGQDISNTSMKPLHIDTAV